MHRNMHECSVHRNSVVQDFSDFRTEQPKRQPESSDHDTQIREQKRTRRVTGKKAAESNAPRVQSAVTKLRLD